MNVFKYAWNGKNRTRVDSDFLSFCINEPKQIAHSNRFYANWVKNLYPLNALLKVWFFKTNSVSMKKKAV